MSKFTPYVLFPTMGSFKRPVLVCAPSFAGAVRVVTDRLWFPVQGKNVIDFTIDANSLPGSPTPYYRLDPETTCASLIKELKALLLEYGGSPEAVLLIHGISPFTQRELDIMAKAATKVAKKAEKPAKAEAPKRKGNPEALAKARAAGDGKRAEFAAKKIKGLVKLKDAGLREGSGRAAKLEAILTAKTVGDVIGTSVTDSSGKTHTIDAGAINGAVSRGHVELN